MTDWKEVKCPNCGEIMKEDFTGWFIPKVYHQGKLEVPQLQYESEFAHSFHRCPKCQCIVLRKEEQE